MHTKWKLAYVATAVSLVVAGAAPVSAAPDHDNPAGVLIYPKVVVDLASGIDTRLHLSNTSDLPQMAHCFYVNANSHCTNTGGVCSTFMDCQDTATGFFGACVPGWIETNFDIFLTSRQPLGWVASEGLAGNDLPCRSTFLQQNPCGVNNGSNNGTRIPPISETPYVGELKCIQADPISRLPVACAADTCRNDLTGNAAITDGDTTDVASYPAAGLHAVQNDGDNTLVVGGPSGEYEPCADVLVMDFVYDGAIDPISGTLEASSELTLVPCSEDFRGQSTPAVVAQFLVYNEFEQRLSTSRRVECLLDTPISRIDTSQPDRSIFNVQLGGTIMGQARIRGVGGGLTGVALLALATDYTLEETRLGWSSYALDTVVETSVADNIRLP
jgi:hypothetical protein